MTRIQDSDHDDQLREWAAAWQAAPSQVTPTADLQRFVQTRTRRLRWWVAGELLVGGVALPVLLYIAATTPRLVERSAMISLAVITVGAMAFSLWNWRSMLRASAWTTTAYVESAVRLVHGKRLAWRAAWLVLVGEVAVLTAWIWDHFHAANQVGHRPNAEVFAWSWLGGMTTAAVVVLVLTGRWIAREAVKLEGIGRELGLGTGADAAQQVRARRSRWHRRTQGDRR